MSNRLLVCDDSSFMRSAIIQTLEGAGYTVVGEAETGADAVRMYKELKPDVVTMDVVMPDVSGLEAVREIVSEDANAHIVMCSAVGQETFVSQAIEAGASSYVVKPFGPPELIEAVKRATGEIK